MDFIFLENWNDQLHVASKLDNSGEVFSTDNIEEAEEVIDQYCQDGQIIPIGWNLVKLLKDTFNSIMSMDLTDEDIERKFRGLSSFMRDMYPLEKTVDEYETLRNLSPFDKVVYTGSTPHRDGIVKRVTDNGIFVLFDIQSTSHFCTFENLELPYKG